MSRSGVALALIVLLTSRPLDVEGSRPRQERALPLLFPPTAPTRIQWIVGVGIPLEDLVVEAMTTGYVLKAEYFLPETVDQLRTKSTVSLNGRALGTRFERQLADGTPGQLWGNATAARGRWSERRALSSYRWALYDALQGLAERVGLRPARSCVLKSICEAAEAPFHHWNGVLGELLHVLLTPSSSADELSQHSDNEYFHAEALGRSGADCGRVFADCRTSLLGLVSEVRSLTNDVGTLLG